MVQAVVVFLVAMLVLAVIGRFKRGRGAAARCRGCGRPRIGKGPCPCGKRA